MGLTDIHLVRVLAAAIPAPQVRLPLVIIWWRPARSIPIRTEPEMASELHSMLYVTAGSASEHRSCRFLVGGHACIVIVSRRAAAPIFEVHRHQRAPERENSVCPWVATCRGFRTHRARADVTMLAAARLRACGPEHSHQGSAGILALTQQLEAQHSCADVLMRWGR